MRRYRFTMIALLLSASLFLGALSLEAAAPSFTPTITRQTVVFKACSAKKNAERKKEIEERLRKKAPRSWETKKNKRRD